MLNARADRSSNSTSPVSVSDEGRTARIDLPRNCGVGRAGHHDDWRTICRDCFINNSSDQTLAMDFEQLLRFSEPRRFARSQNYCGNLWHWSRNGAALWIGVLRSRSDSPEPLAK